MGRFFWLVRGKHYGANWHVFTELSLAEKFCEKHYKQFSDKGFELVQVQELK